MPCLKVDAVFADDFRRGRDYTNLRPNGSGDWLLIYTLRGSGLFVSATGAAHRSHPGEVILYRPEEFQDYSTNPAEGRWHLLWAHFVERPEWNPLLQWAPSPEGFRIRSLWEGESRERFQDAMRRCSRWSHQQMPLGRQFALNALEEALLWTHAVAGSPRRPDARVRSAMDYLADGSRREFSLEALARHAGVSVSRLALLFKQETGFSPRYFWERSRLQRAAALLRLTSVPIAEVAAETGFEDPFYFSNRFKKMFGRSPTAYRRAD